VREEYDDESEDEEEEEGYDAGGGCCCPPRPTIGLERIANPSPPIVPPLEDDPDLDRLGDNAKVETEDVDGIDGRADTRSTLIVVSWTSAPC